MDSTLDQASITIHIGMPKSASTTLQLGLFAPCPAWEYVGQGDRTTAQADLDPVRPDWIWPLISMEQREYERHASTVRETIEQRLDPDKPLVLSEEGFTFSPYLTDAVHYGDRGLIAQRLHQLMPNAKILFVIRNQYRLIESLYGHLSRGGWMKSPGVSEWIALCLKAQAKGQGTPLSIPQYHDVYELYAQQFGKERVKVMLMEEMMADPLDGARRVSEWVGVPWDQVEPHVDFETRNQGFTREENVLRHLYDSLPAVGRFVPKGMRRAAVKLARSGKKMTIAMTQEDQAVLRDQYANGNQMLAETCGLNLGSHGYPMCDPVLHNDCESVVQ